MKGSLWIATLPEQPGPDRDAAIVQAARDGIAHVSYASISLGGGLVINVSCDAVLFGEDGDYVRAPMSPVSAQQVADILGCLLPTSRICDSVHMLAGKVLTPCLQTADAQMDYTSRALSHSMCVDSKLSGFPGLVSTVGKDWVLSAGLSAHPGMACNYGWHDKSAPFKSPCGLSLWQQEGFAHNYAHSDYSQTQRLVQRSEELEQAYLAGDPRVSYAGPVPLRYPGIDDASGDAPTKVDVTLPTLRLGSQGEDVRRWQQIVHVTADGVFGQATDKATRGFQATHGLVVDGVVGQETWKAALGA